MIISKSVIGRCKCGVIRSHPPLMNSGQISFLSSKPPTKNNEPEKEKSSTTTGSPLSPEHLKLISQTSSKLAEALKLRYADTLKQGSIWYQQKVDSFSQRRGAMGGGEWYTEKVGFWMKRYENFVGLTEVKAAQFRVVETEKLFIHAQDERREAQNKINEVQAKIKALHGELEKTHRGEDRYLTLITQEHQILKEERLLTENLHFLEKAERIRFSELSNTVRDSHEKERAQAEKTKYWSVIGSVVGTCLGILGTTINNRMRMKELRQIVRDASMASSGIAIATTAGGDNSFELIKSLIEKQQKDLIGVSEKIVSANKEISSKLQEINQISTNLSDAVKSANSSQPKEPVYKPVPIGLTGKDLNIFFETQQKTLEKQLSDLKLALLGHTSSVSERLSIETIKRAEESEKRLLEALNRTNVASYKAFHTRACDIDEKVKDIRSLVLAQAMTSVNPVVSGSTASSNQAQIDNLDRSQRTIIGTVELALHEHEERVRSSVVLAGIFTAILTPVVLYALDKLG